MTREPTPLQMLFEGAQDTVAALKLMRLGAVNNVPSSDMVRIIDAHISELSYAIAAHERESVA